MEGEHPEIRPGEMWLTNSYDEHYDQILYETKRKGRVAYAPSGYHIQGLFPVFIKKEEYNEHMEDIRMRKLHDDIVRSRLN